MKIRIKETYFSTRFFGKKKYKELDLNSEDFEIVHKARNLSLINALDADLSCFLPELNSKTITIVFTNFNPFLYFLRKISLFSINKYKDSSFHFNENKIIVSKTSFSHDEKTLPNIMLKAGIRRNVILDCIICHELGHAVQYNYVLERKSLFPSLNDTCHFLNSVIFLHNGFRDIYQIETLKISLLENFADLFSMILMFRILDRKTFELVFETLYNHRKDNNILQKYYSFNSLSDLKLKILSAEKTVLNLNSYNEIEEFISIIICDNLEKIITEIIPSPMLSDSLAMGFIAGACDLKVSHVLHFKNALLSKYPFLTYLNCLDMDNKKFLEGIDKSKQFKAKI